MRNLDLAQDYLKRTGVRLGALEILYRGERWADVVRESQAVVDLALKALLRASGVEVPRVRDVAPILYAERARLPESLASHVDELADAPRQLRRDRELAFYGTEDLTPGEFYARTDADRALAYARRVVELVTHHFPGAA
jgi:HEPN domain-containing protein